MHCTFMSCCHQNLGLKLANPNDRPENIILLQLLEIASPSMHTRDPANLLHFNIWISLQFLWSAHLFLALLYILKSSATRASFYFGLLVKVVARYISQVPCTIRKLFIKNMYVDKAFNWRFSLVKVPIVNLSRVEVPPTQMVLCWVSAF